MSTNVPALKEHNLPAMPFEAPGPQHRITLLNYSNLILFSVCMMLTGVVVGLEQGRKPLFVEMRERAERLIMDQKIATVKSAIESFKVPPNFKDFRVIEGENTVEIHFGTADLFGTGQANISAETEEQLTELAKTLLPVAGKVPVRIEAFTDNSPMSANSWQYPTNWELSGARAARVLRVFHHAGFEDLTFVGYGESRPLFPNVGDDGKVAWENRLRNRRLVIHMGPL